MHCRREDTDFLLVSNLKSFIQGGLPVTPAKLKSNLHPCIIPIQVLLQKRISRNG